MANPVEQRAPAARRARASEPDGAPPPAGPILLVGDWFVDDHWVLGTHRSSTSSRTGRRHLAALQEIGSATESLCGAGRTAAVLWGAGFSILGVGLCARSDEEVLLSLLDTKGLKGLNPHTLRRWERVEPPERARFCNLGDEGTGTSRAIRIYERVGAATVLAQRLDWETPPPRALRLEALQSLLRQDGDAIQAVILEDLAKGFIRDELVGLLIQELADRPWFVCSKAWRPPWFAALSRVTDVRLLVVPEVAARAALGARIDDDRVVRRSLASWMVASGSQSPSKGALALVDNKLLRGAQKGSRPTRGVASTVVVVPDDRTVLALDASEQCYVHRQPAAAAVAVPMAMSSVLLGALSARMLRHPGADLAEIVGGAATFTYQWRDFEARRVTDYRDWNPADEPRDQLRVKAGRGARLNWKLAHEEWKQAFTLQTLGIIEAEDGPRLELWRAMTELPGYICVVRRKRESLATLVQMVRSFSSAQSKQESCLIQAPAGTGKTHLVRCLAAQAKLQVLQFNITHLFHREGLLDCFDRISTTQAESQDTPLLIFFDEINADLDNGPPYGTFLSPLEDGIYVRAEKSFHIGPAVWLFAGTELDRSKPKAPDFLSRLTYGIVPLSAPEDDPEADSGKLERVYLAASLLKRTFPEIELIGQDVLDLFSRLPGDISTRRMAQIAASFRNVRRRKVICENIPWGWINDSGDRALRSLQEDWKRRWDSRPEAREVRLVTERG